MANSKKIVFALLAVLAILSPVRLAAAQSCAGHILEVPIFGAGNVCIAGPGTYVVMAYSLAMGVGVIYAVILMSAGALVYGSAGDNANRKKEGMDRFRAALIGLFLLFGTNLYLRTINPDLINLTLMEEKGYFENLGMQGVLAEKNDLSQICSQMRILTASCYKSCASGIKKVDPKFDKRSSQEQSRIVDQLCTKDLCKNEVDALRACFQVLGAGGGNFNLPSW